MATAVEQTETVTISIDRLKELEAAAEKLPILKEKLKKRNQRSNNIERLNAYYETHPNNSTERSKRSREKNREAYNARRRELYRLKRGAIVATAPVVVAQPL